MKKVIFEQIGNIITTLLLLAASFEIIHNFNVESYQFQLSFGVSRVIYIKFDQHYDMKKGEFSISDEREAVISHKASIGAYKALIFTLIVFF
ncbi:hypothetical protein [Staphylococcus delphini]|uniref:hypothetical protein n=1 Tax=Staphylococcus delphini TaxID=53344 RepID=UPI0021D20C14|nr:hypothetical protein [Staphylococcus delphini]UXS44504.1 hypothetical protein MUA39_00910 [Staphylococcus delphini]UXV45131.1 hypothetical protein MUA63_00900 [Staphylococcus delphini]